MDPDAFVFRKVPLNQGFKGDTKLVDVIGLNLKNNVLESNSLTRKLT